MIYLDSEKQKALQVVARYFEADLKRLAQPTEAFPDWAERRFYISDTQALIRFLMWQKVVLNFLLDPELDFQTIVFSDIKKSGKTTVAGAVARWIAETWGKYNEVFCMANDEEQARGRIYQKVQESIELDPTFDKGKRGIPNEWRIIRRAIENEANGSFVKSVSNDNRGEAGSNPTGTFWSELWGYTSEDDLRLYEELTPVPTRARSIRWIDSYAGYEGESELLYEVYDRIVKHGDRLTHADLVKYGGWPFDDPPPIFVHQRSRSVAFWDEGIVARRLPWQTEQYYQEQAATLRPLQFERLHLNHWTSSVDSFIPIEWLYNLADGALPHLTPKEPVVMGVDASVSGDCTAAILVSRDPRNRTRAAIRRAQVWVPPHGGKLNYNAEGGLKPTILDWIAKYNVVQVAYDEFQLHHLMNEIRDDRLAWCRVFSQNASRLTADKQLYDMIRDRELAYNTNELTNIELLIEHAKNAAAKLQKDEDSKLRIIKKGKLPIDLVVALSMAVSECMRLTLS